MNDDTMTNAEREALRLIENALTKTQSKALAQRFFSHGSIVADATTREDMRHNLTVRLYIMRNEFRDLFTADEREAFDSAEKALIAEDVKARDDRIKAQFENEARQVRDVVDIVRALAIDTAQKLTDDDAARIVRALRELYSYKNITIRDAINYSIARKSIEDNAMTIYDSRSLRVVRSAMFRTAREALLSANVDDKNARRVASTVTTLELQQQFGNEAR